MIVCPKCKKEHSSDSSFCGFCGSSLISAHIVVDGKKNKKQFQLLNKIYNSDSTNILYIVAFSFAFVCLVALGIYSILKLVSDFSRLEYHIWQIVAKYEYINEGVGISYISSSLSFALSYILLAVFSLGIIMNLPAVIFNIAFGGYLLYYKKRKVLQFGVQKPVGLVKMKMFVSKIWRGINLSLIGILILISALKFYLI